MTSPGLTGGQFRRPGRAGPRARLAACGNGIPSSPAPPSALADELVERLPQDRLAASGGERLALRAPDAHHRLPPGGRVVAPHAVLAERGPDLVLAQSQHVSGHRTADGDVPVRGERVDFGLAEHAARVPWRQM
jgi:hypothetical protein